MAHVEFINWKYCPEIYRKWLHTLEKSFDVKFLPFFINKAFEGINLYKATILFFNLLIKQAAEITKELLYI